jgi:hypothetical protein
MVGAVGVEGRRQLGLGGQEHRASAHVESGLVSHDLAPLEDQHGASEDLLGVGRFLARCLAERLHRPYMELEGFFRSASGRGRFDVGDCDSVAAVASLVAGDVFG